MKERKKNLSLLLHRKGKEKAKAKPYVHPSYGGATSPAPPLIMEMAPDEGEKRNILNRQPKTKNNKAFSIKMHESRKKEKKRKKRKEIHAPTFSGKETHTLPPLHKQKKKSPPSSHEISARVGGRQSKVIIP